MIDLIYHVVFLHDYNTLNNRQNNDRMVRSQTFLYSNQHVLVYVPEMIEKMKNQIK